MDLRFVCLVLPCLGLGEAMEFFKSIQRSYGATLGKTPCRTYYDSCFDRCVGPTTVKVETIATHNALDVYCGKLINMENCIYHMLFGAGGCHDNVFIKDMSAYAAKAIYQTKIPLCRGPRRKAIPLQNDCFGDLFFDNYLAVCLDGVDIYRTDCSVLKAVPGCAKQRAMEICNGNETAGNFMRDISFDALVTMLAVKRCCEQPHRDKLC